MPDSLALIERAVSQMTNVVEQVPDEGLDNPTPCSDWAVRDLLSHLLYQALPNFAAAARCDPPNWGRQRAELGEDWKQDYRREAAAVLDAWRAADLDRLVPMHGGQEAPLGGWIGQQSAELTMHAWDLVRALDLPVTLDDELAEQALAWSSRMLRPEVRQKTGAFGPEVPVPEDAPAYDRLAGWFGRDPQWRPLRSVDA